MNRSARLGLAALTLLLGGFGTASACSLAAWTSSTGSPVTGGPTDANTAVRDVKKISGACGLKAANPGPSFVVESTSHAAEGSTSPFRARFYVFTGVTGGAAATVFRAMDADSGGNAVVTVVYNESTQNFSFTVNGSTASTTAGTAPLSGWVSVEMVYQANQAFSATTRRLDVATALASPPTAGASSIQAVQLGLIAGGGGSGNYFFDEYESSRSATAGSGSSGVFTMRCRGDANGSGSITAGDRASITAEIGGAAATGQSDCNESGSVTAGDRACVTALIGTLATCS